MHLRFAASRYVDDCVHDTLVFLRTFFACHAVRNVLPAAVVAPTPMGLLLADFPWYQMCSCSEDRAVLSLADLRRRLEVGQVCGKREFLSATASASVSKLHLRVGALQRVRSDCGHGEAESITGIQRSSSKI